MGNSLLVLKRDIYAREFLLNLESYNGEPVTGTTEFIESSEATSCLININCEELGGTGFFPLQASSGGSKTVTKQFTIQNEISVGITLVMYPSGKQFEITIKATNIGTEYLYYDFFVDIIRTF